jgi:Fe-S oxidoreductase
MRLKISKKVFLEQDITENERLSLYTCTLCALCDFECPQEIHISEIIHKAKNKLAEKGKGPLGVHNKISEGILKFDNSVNGNPEDRLDWLPDKYQMEEKYEKSDSNTLLFLGCMSSFKVKESASSSYELLKKAGYDFKIFKEEPCCGEYLYSSGKVKEAKDYFAKVYDLLKRNNVEKIIGT